MSQVAERDLVQIEMDPYEIGWYVESTDEEIYGPLSRQTLARRFLEEKVISPNTLIRHCTQPEAKPAADQPGMLEGLNLDSGRPAVGDKLAEAWPRKGRDQQALAEGSLPCAWHRRPAVLVCFRCHAPYCNKCRAKPFRKQFFLCSKCNAGIYNRRFIALMLDSFLLYYVPFIIVVFVIGATMGLAEPGAAALVNVISVLLICSLLVRDSFFGGAGPGKRVTGLRVVGCEDGKTPLTVKQGIIRWLSQFIPVFNLIDAMAPYRDPLLRRYGDRWAHTRVIDTEPKLVKAQQKVARRLIKKGVRPAREFGMTMAEFARLV